MSFLGKLLVSFQFVLSILFLTFAGAVFSTQQNWKTAKEDADKRTAQIENEKRDLDADYQRYKTQSAIDLKNEQAKAQTAEGRAETLEKQVVVLEKELNGAKTERDEQTSLAKVTVDEAAQRRDEALRQREVNNDLQKLLNDKNNRLKALEDIVFNKTVEEKSLQDKHAKLLADLAIFQKIIAANGLSTDPKSVSGLQTPPPAVDGQVLETKRGGRNGNDLVEISLGSDDGLLEGHKLSVFRPAAGERHAKYLGEIKIVYVTPDRAVGSVALRAKNGIIERGDNVTSKL